MDAVYQLRFGVFIYICVKRSEKPGHVPITLGLVELDLSARIDTSPDHLADFHITP
jgi:hypothetical protein